MLSSSLNSNIAYQESLPLLVTIAISCVIFHYIVRPFSGFNEPAEILRALTGEETLEILNSIGLNFLTFNGSFFTIIVLYLWQLHNLTEIINLNLSTLDPDILRHILGRLKFLITNHELIFGVMSSFVHMYENLEHLDFDFDPETLEVQVRNAGNNLFSLYRNIEKELNIDISDLPIHWTEE